MDERNRESAQIEIERRSIAMLTVGQPALNRERALELYRKYQETVDERDALLIRVEQLELGIGEDPF